ncbi:MAG: peptidylprolyl isomerase [Lachnospiraceae bacterium]
MSRVDGAADVTVKNPLATLCMQSGEKIVIELLYAAAPNTVCSFLWAAARGIYDRHAVERIVPGDWIDMSYTAFGREDARYLLPSEFDLHPEITPLPSHFGCVCMGGYGSLGLAGCEFFFPLRDCPEHRGIYPVFGKVIQGSEVLRRLEQVQLQPVTDYPEPGVVVNEPVLPEILEQVELELFGQSFPAPVRVTHDQRPACWSMMRHKA